MTDPRYRVTPEPGMGSGVTPPPAADAAPRPAAGGDVSPKLAPDAGLRGPAAATQASPAAAAAAEGQEPGASVASAASASAAVVDVEPELAEAADVQADIAELTARAAKADEYLALAQRTQADFENYRKRALREAKAAQERGALKLVQSLLPAIDNLDRALAHMDSTVADGSESNGTASLVAGIKHVHADVIAALGAVGVEPFDPVGEPFDPQYHEAVAQHPVQGAQPGTVVEVFQRGYRVGETVVRPARVVVAG